MMNSISSLTNNKRIPCKYIIAKYVDDEIRDEPVNVGVIIQSQENYEILSKFVTDYRSWKLKNASAESNTLLREMLMKIKEDVSSANQNEVLCKILSKYGGKLRFTEPRGTLALNLVDETESLFDRYIDKIYYPIYFEIQFQLTHERITKDVYHFLYLWDQITEKESLKKEYLLNGKNSKFKYDIALLDERHLFFQAISFDEKTALDRTKLFDWSVKDTIEEHEKLSIENFHVIFSPPSESNPKYWKMKEKYKEAIEILSYNSYPQITYDKDDNWKKEIEQLI